MERLVKYAQREGWEILRDASVSEFQKDFASIVVRPPLLALRTLAKGASLSEPLDVILAAIRWRTH
jgi:hypothetical protein